MNIEPSGQLRQGLFALDRSQCHFGFKCRRMIAAGSLRHGSPSFQAISSPVMNGVATYPVVSKSGSSSNWLGKAWDKWAVPIIITVVGTVAGGVLLGLDWAAVKAWQV